MLFSCFLKSSPYFHLIDLEKHLAPVYIDETAFDTYFYREYARSLKYQLIIGKVSGRRYQRISLVAGLTNGELINSLPKFEVDE